MYRDTVQIKKTSVLRKRSIQYSGLFKALYTSLPGRRVGL